MNNQARKLEGEGKIFRALELLGTLLGQRTPDPISLVVCGGSALIALGLIPRTTKDIDVVALLDGHKFVTAVPMPEILVEAALLVALELNLPSEWLNPGPTSILNENLPNQGFPSGFQERLTRRDFGPALSIYLISRYDQIHFKLYAAADQGGSSQHFTDLVILKPTDDELLAAVQWARLQDPSQGFLDTVRSMLAAMERSDVLSKL